MAWNEDYSKYKEAGFTESEILEESNKRRTRFADAGFSDKEINEYFGVKEPDMAPIKEVIQNNLNKPDESGQPRVAKSLWDSLDAGFQMSSTDMVRKALKGKSIKPDVVLPEDAPTFMKIASQAATIAGDLPAMVAGGLIGAPIGSTAGAVTVGAAGSVIPGAGTVAGIGVGATAGAIVGAGAGSNALPETLRSVLMNYYEKGEIHDFKDFWERTSAVFLDTVKTGAVGGISMGVGGAIGTKLGTKAVSPAINKLASTSSEIGTMVTLGKAFEGEVPAAQDFLDAGLLIGGLHLATKAPAKLRQIYAKTGARPHEVLEEIQTNPVLRQEILSEGEELPSMYREMTSQDKILSKVGETTEPTPQKYTFDEFYKDYVDKLDPIKKAVEQLVQDPSELKTETNPYKLSRMASDSPAKVKHFYEKGTLDFETLETKGKSFKEIVSPFKDDLEGLKAYLISKRTVELEDRGIHSGFDVNATKDVITKGSEKYETVAKELVQFQNETVKYLKDSGIISEKTYNNLIEVNKNYVSFKRITEDGEISTSGTNPIKKIKGSDLMIQDPFTSMIENSQLYLKLAERNRAVRSIVELAEKNKDQNLIERVPGKARSIEVSEAEIARAFKEQGIEVDPEAITIFRGQQKELAPNEFEVFRNGKREVYKTDPILAEAINTLKGNAPTQNIAFKLMKGITSVKRLGISLAPDFMLRNFFRDQLTAGTFSESGTIPLKDTIIAMGDILKKNDHYYNWLKAGGANGAFLEMGEKYLTNNIFDLDQSTGFIDKTWNIVKKPIHYLELAGQLAEQSTRLAEAKKVMAGENKGSKIFDAGFASREITIDFQRVGAKISALNSITAFQNAQIQGLDRSIRALKENPTLIAQKAAMYITAPSMLIWWSNKDDERYKEIPRWEKDLFWIIPTDNWVKAQPNEIENGNLPPHLVRENNGVMEINKGVVYRLPKPQELGILFGSLPERILEKFFTDNPDAMNDLGETITDLITPALIPDAIAPVFEQYANKSFFTDNKIVSNHLEGILPQYQYTDYTTESGKLLSKMVMTVPSIGELGPRNAPLASPMVLENYVRSWSGTLGMYALKLADQALIGTGIIEDPIKPAMDIEDYPFVKAFIARYPGANAQSIQDFYEKFEENSKVLETIQKLASEGQLNEVEKIQLDERNKERMLPLQGVYTALRNQNKYIQTVFKNPTLTRDEKRQQIDGVYYGMIETAKMGLEMVKEWKESLEDEKKLIKSKDD